MASSWQNSCYILEKNIIVEQCKGVHCVDLGESFQTHIFLQNLTSIQPITSPVKFALHGARTRGPSCPDVRRASGQAGHGEPARAHPRRGARARRQRRAITAPPSGPSVSSKCVVQLGEDLTYMRYQLSSSRTLDCWVFTF